LIALPNNAQKQTSFGSDSSGQPSYLHNGRQRRDDLLRGFREQTHELSSEGMLRAFDDALLLPTALTSSCISPLQLYFMMELETKHNTGLYDKKAKLKTERSTDIIHWLSHGLSFRIIDQERFSSEIAPKYFKRECRVDCSKRKPHKSHIAHIAHITHLTLTHRTHLTHLTHCTHCSHRTHRTHRTHLTQILFLVTHSM
jgi:hypothetical protein